MLGVFITNFLYIIIIYKILQIPIPIKTIVKKYPSPKILQNQIPMPMPIRKAPNIYFFILQNFT